MASLQEKVVQSGAGVEIDGKKLARVQGRQDTTQCSFYFVYADKIRKYDKKDAKGHLKALPKLQVLQSAQGHVSMEVLCATFQLHLLTVGAGVLVSAKQGQWLSQLLPRTRAINCCC